MRKNIKLIALLVASVFLVFTIGCAKEVEGSDEDVLRGDAKGQSEESINEDDDGTVVLKFWSWFSYENIIREFEKENEGIKVEQQLFEFGKCEEAYMEAITKGEGPDVLILDVNLRDLDGMEILQQCGPALTGGERVVGVRNPDALLRGQVARVVVDPRGLELLVLRIR